jgi:DNA gyrase subunit A
VRARASIETGKNDRQSIIVSEIPYQVNKAGLIEKIADLVNEKKLEDISDIRDESDRDGLRIVIELKREANAEVILNNLYKHTSMQTTFGVIMLALVDGRPKVLTLKEMLRHFIDHRNEVVVRRTKYDLEEAEKRAHILEGYIIALDNIDAIIKLIKSSKDVDTAQAGLMKKFKLSEIQAKAILDMRLQRLTGLERKKIEDEYRETIKLIERLKSILKSKQLQLEIIKKELRDLKEEYGDERRTEIIYTAEEFSIEDMIAEEQVVVTVSHGGFVKRFPVSGYRRQSRGGRGSTGATTKEDDFIEFLLVAGTHEYLMLFMNTGRCYWLKVHEIPEAGRTSRGKSIVNLIAKQTDEMIASYVTVKNFTDPFYVVMFTEHGTIKKTPLSEFSNPRRSGIAAIGLGKGDRLIDARLTDGKQDIVIGTRSGMAIRFHEKEVRPMGRTASGVRAITLGKHDLVVGSISLRRTDTTILVATELGYGKRSETGEYRVSHRGGKGIITVKTTEKTGPMVCITEVMDTDDVVIVTNGGKIIRQHASDIRVAGRNTQGVRLIRLEGKDVVSDVSAVPSEEDEVVEAQAGKVAGAPDPGERAGSAPAARGPAPTRPAVGPASGAEGGEAQPDLFVEPASRKRGVKSQKPQVADRKQSGKGAKQEPEPVKRGAKAAKPTPDNARQPSLPAGKGAGKRSGKKR